MFNLGLQRYAFFEYTDYSHSIPSVIDAISKYKDGSKKILFLALQFQPEVTSVPMTRPWFTTDQLILFISSYLPSNWVLVVKEHPNMYADSVGSLINFRSNTIYSMICNLSTVVLAPYNFKSNILISQSDLVITGTGSVGTEALLSNKPVCCLGNAPYVGLPNVYTSNNFTELSDFLIQLDSSLPFSFFLRDF